MSNKTFAAIEKLKEVEVELHRLKNYAEMMNRSVEAKKEWVGLTEEEIFAAENAVPDAVITDRDWSLYFAQAIETKLKEKNT